MKNFTLLFIFLSTVIPHTLYAKRDHFCVKNTSVQTFWVFNAGGSLLGQVNATKSLGSIKRNDFPLTIADCNGLSCDPSNNKSVHAPDCYDIYYYGGFVALRWSCLVGC